MWSSFEALEMSSTGWKVLRVDQQGTNTILASGTATMRTNWPVRLERNNKGNVTIWTREQELWTSPPQAGIMRDDPGAIGFWVKPNTHLVVKKFKVSGSALPAHLNYLGVEALLGAGESLDHWDARHGPEFRYGIELVSKEPHARVKWNGTGTSMTLWSPRGPEFGQAEILLDGLRRRPVNLYAEHLAASQPVWTSVPLRGNLHAVVWRALTGNLPVDTLEVRK